MHLPLLRATETYLNRLLIQIYGIVLPNLCLVLSQSCVTVDSFSFQIDGQQLRYKTFEEVLELLKQTNPDEDGKKKIIKQTMPPVLASIASDIDLDASKIDSLLSHSPPKYVYT